MSISELILRGALGGIVGGIVFLIGLTMHDISRLGYAPYGGVLQLMAVPYMLFVGLILGSITGLMVWVIECRSKIHLPTIIRVIVGVVLVFLIVHLMQLLFGESKVPLNSTRTERLVNEVMFLTAFGALPAIFARPTSDPADPSNE